MSIEVDSRPLDWIAAAGVGLFSLSTALILETFCLHQSFTPRNMRKSWSYPLQHLELMLNQSYSTIVIRLDDCCIVLSDCTQGSFICTAL